MIKVLVKVLQSDVNVNPPPPPPSPNLPNHQSSQSRGNNLIYFYCMEGRVWGGNKADKNRASVSTWHLNQIQSTDLNDSSLPARATPEQTGCPTSVSQVLRPLLTPGARLTALAQKKTFLCGQTCQSSGIYRRTDKPQSPFFLQCLPKIYSPNSLQPSWKPKSANCLSN